MLIIVLRNYVLKIGICSLNLMKNLTEKETLKGFSLIEITYKSIQSSFTHKDTITFYYKNIYYVKKIYLNGFAEKLNCDILAFSKI